MVPWASMKAHIPLLLLALSCASPEHGELHKGTYRPPARAPAFSPAEDAPHTTGQPGHIRQRPERSPHKRVLPPSTESGLWSGDSPRAARISTPPSILTERIPLPSKEDEERVEVRACSDIFGFAMAATPALADRFLALPPRRRECVALRRFHECMTETQVGDAERIAAFVANIIAKRCAPPNPEDEQLANDILVAVVKYIDRGGGQGGPRH